MGRDGKQRARSQIIRAKRRPLIISGTVLMIVRMWQRERVWQGPHWRQLKSTKFQSAGYGIAHYGGRKTQIVVDFYGGYVE